MDEGIKLLLACLRREEQTAKINQLQGYRDQDWEAVLAAARRHAVVPILFYTLKPFASELSIPEAIWEKMQNIYYLSASRNIVLYHKLLKILAELKNKGISVILLKGAHLAESVYENIALRPMIDVDLLAREDDLQGVHQVLIEQGYSSADGNLSCQLHMAPYDKKDGLLMEVHFQIARPPVSRRFDITTLWERAQNLSTQGSEVLTLCPEDLILHLSMHTSIDHGFENGLLPYLDLWKIMEHYGDSLDWDQLWERANEWGIERSVFLMLALTEKMLGLPMPDQINRKMKLDGEALRVLNDAEEMIFKSGEGVSPIVARMFGKQGWREKFDYFIRRTFPPSEKMSVAFQGSGGRKSFKVYWLYLLRVYTLIKIHGKMIWSGVRRDPEAVMVLEMENRKNNLRDWLTKTGFND